MYNLFIYFFSHLVVPRETTDQSSGADELNNNILPGRLQIDPFCTKALKIKQTMP